MYTNDYNNECPAMADPMQFEGIDPVSEIDAHYTVTTKKHVEFTVPMVLVRTGSLQSY